MGNRNRTVKVVMAVVGVFACTAPALAGFGDVLPPNAKPDGYSLKQAAKVTAVYNTGQAAGIAVTPPDVPFHVLTDDATVKTGTTLYVPIFFADDSGEVAPGFPKHIDDEDACADFLDDFVFDAFGVERFIIQVDGKTTVLHDDDIVGTKTKPLPDGPPAGTDYIVCAVFLTPLTKGTHTVSYGGIIGGEDVVFVSFTVTVR